MQVQPGPDADRDEDSILRELTFPEEDRRLYTTATWRGEYRWFRSPNIIPLERYRKQFCPKAEA